MAPDEKNNPLTRDRTGTGADAPKSSGDDLGSAEVQATVDEAEDKGYLGTVADPTPNHAYTLGGVTSGEPTPETDPDLAAKVRADATKRAAETKAR